MPVYRPTRPLGVFANRPITTARKQMDLAKITRHPQMRIPNRIRVEANLGDVIAFEIEGEHVQSRKITPRQYGYM